jgi:hypothetical protein
MSYDYTEDTENHSYTATLETSTLHPETMTDTGVLVQDLTPIYDACLTPGDPSPAGRTEDGDLAYPIFPNNTYVSLKREEVASLAHIWAKTHGITEGPVYPLTTGSPMVLFANLLNEALPRAFYDDTNHGEISREQDIKALLSGDFSSIKRHWGQGEE